MRAGRAIVVLALPVLGFLGAHGGPAVAVASSFTDALPLGAAQTAALIRADGYPELVALLPHHPSAHHRAASRSHHRGTPVRFRRTRPQLASVPLQASAPAAPPSPVPVPVAPAPAPAPAPATDGYPYAQDSSGANDPWGFTMRQCVSYVAWRLSEAGHPLNNASEGWGNASHWDDAARRLGYAVSSSPKVGAVAQWHAGETSAYYLGSAVGQFQAGGYGHVAWVTAVYADGSVQVSQYNGDGNRSFTSAHLRAPRYLYVG